MIFSIEKIAAVKPKIGTHNQLHPLLTGMEVIFQAANCCTSLILVLVAAFLILLFAGIPIAYILGLVALLGISQLNSISMITVVQKMFTGLNSFTLLAVPLFVLAANIMNRAKISEIEFNWEIPRSATKPKM